MPRTSWLLAAATVLPLLVPPSAVSYPPGLEARRSAPRRSVGRASAGRSPIRRRRRRSRSVSSPGYGAPERLPWYRAPACGRPRARAALVQEHAHDPRRGARRGVHRPRPRHRGASAGLMRVEDGFTWVTLPSESEEAYAKLTAGLTPRPARTFPGVGEHAKLPVARVDEVVEYPSAATRRRATARTLDRRAGRRRASGAHGGVAAQDPPPPRVDAASGARGTGVGVHRRAGAGTGGAAAAVRVADALALVLLSGPEQEAGRVLGARR